MDLKLAIDSSNIERKRIHTAKKKFVGPSLTKTQRNRPNLERGLKNQESRMDADVVKQSDVKSCCLVLNAIAGKKRRPVSWGKDGRESALS